MILDYLKEAMQLFKELTPENQMQLLMYTRVAHAAEQNIKKSINDALGGKDFLGSEKLCQR